MTKEQLSPTVRHPETSIRPNDNPDSFLNFDVTGTPRFAGDVNGDSRTDYVYTTRRARDERTANPEDTTGKAALFFGGVEPNAGPDQKLYAFLRPVGDVDSDGHNDALVLRADGSVQIYAGTASGYEETDLVATLSSPDLVRGFTDLDGDGIDDVLLANQSSGDFNVLFGAFRLDETQWKNYSPSTTDASSYRYNTADFDGEAQGNILRFVGKSPNMRVQNWSFESGRRTLSMIQGFSSQRLKGSAAQNQLSLLEVNGEGRRGIVTTAGEATPLFFFPSRSGRGGILGGHVTVPTRLRETPAYPIGDLDGDGRHDFYAFEKEEQAHTLFYGTEQKEELGIPLEIPYAPTTFGGATFTPHGKLGDLNGDGLDDTILNRATFGGQPYEVGRRFIYGRESRTVATDTLAWLRRHVYDRVLSTANVGDINVDGVPDVAAPFFDRGKVGVYFGGNALSNTPDKFLSVGPFPYALARGDYNGDGNADLAVASWGIDRQTSTLDIFFGASGFGGGAGGEPDRSVSFDQIAPRGYSRGFFQVANGGDLDGDGMDDLIASAPFSVNENTGRALNKVFIFHGGQSLRTPTAVIDYADSLGNGFVGAGYRVSGIGDFNGDGTDDFAVGVRNRRNSNGTTGAVHVFYGGTNLASGGSDLTITPSDQSGIQGFSYGLTGGRDVNGDGAPDLVVTPTFFPQGTAVYVYHGGTENEQGDGHADETYRAPTDLLGPRANQWDYDDDGFVDRNYGSVTLADFTQDGTAEITLNTGTVDSSRLTNALIYHSQSSTEDEGDLEVVLKAPNSTTALGGRYGAAAGDFTNDGILDYVAVQNRDGNEAYWSSRLYQYNPYPSMPPPSDVEAQRAGERVLVSWQRPSSQRSPAGYYVYRGPTPEASVRIDSVGSGTISKDVPPDHPAIYYRVASVSEQGHEGVASQPAVVHPRTTTVTFTARPNPTQRQVTFEYGLPEASKVRLVVYDVLGRKVAVLDQGRRAAGQHEVHFEERLPPGTYFGRLHVENHHYTEKITVVR